MIHFIKKVLNIFLGCGPLSVDNFQRIFPGDDKDLPVEKAEQANKILNFEKGSINYFPKLNLLLEQPFYVRTINNKSRFLQKAVSKVPDRFLYSVENGAILGHNGLVYLQDQRIAITESSKEWDRKTSENHFWRRNDCRNNPRVSRFGNESSAGLLFSAGRCANGIYNRNGEFELLRMERSCWLLRN